jgi:hypothetical protein
MLRMEVVEGKEGLEDFNGRVLNMEIMYKEL